jgi:SagB-type dehydrogenase family enzyme
LERDLDMDEHPPVDIRAYHRRTKHAPDRYALGPATLDWESQPDPFRSFSGARQAALPLRLDTPTPAFNALERQPPAEVNAETLGLFLELALGLSAWKQIEGTSWPLRNNPSSGNLHPTEGWVVLPPVAGIGNASALYHYAPFRHALEERCLFDRTPALPPGGFLLALSSVTWREAWKYGERAFRYCQHDVGHALAAAAYAGACLGWRVRALAEPSDAQLIELLGLGRADACHAEEAEHPDLIAVVSPGDVIGFSLDVPPGRWFGRANRLSEDHEPWPAVEAAVGLTIKPMTASPALAPLNVPDLPGSDLATGTVIRRRRSAQRMTKGIGIGRDAFFRLLSRTLPDPTQVPFTSFPWPARLALFLFVHAVEGLEPGLYVLIRDPASAGRLRAACDPGFAWEVVPDCPLPLYLLGLGDLRATTSRMSCQQAIAGHSAFSLGMVADFARTLEDDGDWAYRRLFWEAGLIGQVLYLEAVAAGVAGTGIGCFLDDSVHALLGIEGDAQDWQSLYHFTVGTAIEDTRLATLPAYAHL